MNGSNRNFKRIQSTSFYVHDSWKTKHSIQKSSPRKEIRRSSYLGGTYLDKPFRSLSPNLPRIPYLQKGNQRYYPTSLRYTPKQRTIVSKVKQQPVQHDTSKKNIPEHALMKSLLSGLENLSSKDLTTTQTKPKSMGNVTTTCPNHFLIDLPGKAPKSNVDFSKMPPIEFKPYLQKCVNDDDAKSEISCFECMKERQRNAARVRKSSSDMNFRTSTVQSIQVVQPQINKNQIPHHLKIPLKRSCEKFTNLVAQRKQFFESCSDHKKPSKLQMEKRNGSDEVTEIYRNFKSVFSTSTLSKRSSSVPPCVMKTLPKNSELFNPDYNFNNCSKKSLIDSIRSKIFNSNSDSDKWRSCKMPKFPKETQRAMSIILSNRNSNLSCRICQRKLNAVEVVDIQTQTSPVTSRQIFWNSRRDSSKIPCTKNLLCNKGLHSGDCEKKLRQKLQVICTENCVCRRGRGDIMTFEQMVIPFQNLNHETNEVPRQFQFESKSSEESLLDILRHNIEDEGHSRTDTKCESRRASSNSSSFTMNGLNGHSNGDLNGCGDIITQNQQRGCWTIGLINSKYRYLTAETFGFKINANGTSLKKKQIWTLEPDNSSGGESLIYLKSHLDKYLAVDSFGNVTCESEEKDPGSKFQISVAEDGTGRWAFRNVVRGYFLGSSSDKLTCTAKVPGDAEFWHIHLAARPQVNLRSVGRKRFAHLSENLDEIHVDANIPWGEDTLFTLEFHADESGKYALHTCNNKYLSNGGKLVDSCSKDCLFSAEYHSGQLALRDRNGAYLSPIGSKAVLKTRSNTVTKDELFSLEDSLPQASFVAALNSRYVSVKQGVDVTANQDEISDHETFQLEFDWSTKRWYIRTMQDKYWTLETGGGIQASGDKRSSNALFDLVWQTDGSLAFRANNGRYVMTKRSGHLYATSDVIDDNCKYYFYLVNRPILVLKCEQGFVGYKSSSSPKLECNKATYECIQVERAEKGIIYFKGQNGKFWHFNSEGVTADSDGPEGFYLELREPTRLCIKTASGNYLTAGKNGVFRIGDSTIENATQWEY